MTKENESFAGEVAKANEKLGAGFLENLTAGWGPNQPLR